MFEPSEKLSVTQFIKRIQGVLSHEIPVVVIKGEIAQFTCAASGHWYFTLKDTGAQIKAVMFRQKSVRVGFLPKIGDQVEIAALVSVYEARGELQVACETLKKAGQGDLYEQFLRLKAKLQNEGLFDAASKKPIPQYVFSVGVVTSAQAAAWADIQIAFKRRTPHIRFNLYSTPVQGPSATQELVRVISKADQAAHDVLIIGRGGGSIEDLWCFNDESVVRAVGRCVTPTIVGVGHESDVTLAEFAADLRAATPTAAVELCSMPTQALLDQFNGLWSSLQRAVSTRLDRLMQQIDRSEMSMVTPQDRVLMAEQKLQASWKHLNARLSYCLMQDINHCQYFAQRLVRSASLSQVESERLLIELDRQMPIKRFRVLDGLDKQLSYFEGMLSAVSPQRNLDKGYAFIHRQLHLEQELVKSVSQVSKGDVLEATVADGRIRLRVEDK